MLSLHLCRIFIFVIITTTITTVIIITYYYYYYYFLFLSLIFFSFFLFLLTGGCFPADGMGSRVGLGGRGRDGAASVCWGRGIAQRLGGDFCLPALVQCRCRRV